MSKREERTREDIEKSEILFTVVENVNWYNYYGKIVRKFLKKLKYNYHKSSNATSAYISQGNKIIISKRYLYSDVYCSIIAALFTIAKV